MPQNDNEKWYEIGHTIRVVAFYALLAIAAYALFN